MNLESLFEKESALRRAALTYAGDKCWANSKALRCAALEFASTWTDIEDAILAAVPESAAPEKNP